MSHPTVCICLLSIDHPDEVVCVFRSVYAMLRQCLLASIFAAAALSEGLGRTGWKHWRHCFLEVKFLVVSVLGRKEAEEEEEEGEEEE